MVVVLKVLEEGFSKYIEDPLKANANRINNQETLTPYDHAFPLIQNQLADWDSSALRSEEEHVRNASSSFSAGQQTPLSNRGGRLGINAGLFNSPLSKKKLATSTPGETSLLKTGPKQQNEHQLHKLLMFDMDPDGLPQVVVALLVRLGRDSQESSFRSILRKLVPQFRKSAFSVLHLEKSPDVSLLKNSAAQVSESAKNAMGKNATDLPSSEWNKTSKIKSARELYVGDWMQRPIGETEFGPLVRLLVLFSQFMNSLLNFDGIKKESQEDIFMLMMETWNECPNKKDYQSLCKTILKVMEIGTLGVLRKRGFQVNLRFMAEYSMMLLIVVAYFMFKILLRLLFF